MEEKYVKLSRFVSLILRHKPETIGLTLDNQGYVSIDELLQGINNSGRTINRFILNEIVSSDNKNRYSFNENNTMIRANQGHSIPVNLNLQELTPPEILYHGTVKKYYKSIIENGLIPKDRMYVHLSEDIETAIEVGSRRGKPVLLIVKAREMYNNGYVFYKSKNGIWLISEVDNKYIKRGDYDEEYFPTSL